VRVIPDVAAIDKEFDYLVPPSWRADGRADRLKVGTMVRLRLHGRRVGGWVTAVDVDPPPGVELVELAKLSGEGPPPEIIDLAGWAAWRWAGRRVSFLRAASPPRMVAGVPERAERSSAPAGPADVFDDAFRLGVAVVRQPPSHDPLPVVMAGCRLGDTLVVTPDHGSARHLAIALRRAGVAVALAPDDWALAASGATVVGTRSAVWMPMPELAAVVVVDEHDEALQEERTPTWHAREVALERARRRGVPAVLVSPVPSLEALRAGRLLRPNRTMEREGWPRVDVLDRRRDDPVRGGLFAEGLVERIRGGARVVCVLNRKGRSRLLACGTCGELVTSEDGATPMVQVDTGLTTPDGSESRPAVCASCGATNLRNLRAGVGRAREELAALLGEEVDEVTSDRADEPSTRVVIGTEAVLHRVDEAEVAVLLDFDQELLAARQRASEQAMVLAARAARLVGPRGGGGRLVVQTRLPEHDVVRALVTADPSIVAVAERDRRQERGWPPYGAQCLLAGDGAEPFVASLGRPEGVDILGPRDGRWLLRAGTHEPLLDVLAATPRPPTRVRVEVDPPRV
jgi:primosomal protein N' (replication factor Y)